MCAAARPGQPYRYEAHYRREGVRQLFRVSEPLAGGRHVTVRQHRAAVDFAELREVHDPQVKRVRRVLDQLYTHVDGSLYQAFPPQRARALYERLEFHHTPKPGSGLNMAEIELSVLTGQCLDRRIGSEDELRREVTA